MRDKEATLAMIENQLLISWFYFVQTRTGATLIYKTDLYVEIEYVFFI